MKYTFVTSHHGIDVSCTSLSYLCEYIGRKPKYWTVNRALKDQDEYSFEDGIKIKRVLQIRRPKRG